jgi:hypothetical protein
MTTRRVTYLNDAGASAKPWMQLECALCPNAVLILAHQDPVRVSKLLGWTNVDNVPVAAEGLARVRTVWICAEHTIVHMQPEENQVVQRHPAVTGGRGR